MVRKTKEDAELTRQQILQAARDVFHEYGVSNASLAQVAAAAGVTRGAVYWHFEDKAALFYALHKETLAPLTERGDVWFNDLSLDPLQALESAIQEFILTVFGTPEVLKLFEIMVLRCEYVGDFAPVRQAVNEPCVLFLDKLKVVYQRAADQGLLRSALLPEDLAYDTWAFVTGLFNQLLLIRNCDKLRQRIPAMIAAHIALRRRA